MKPHARVKQVFSFLFLISFLIGCQSMSYEDCIQADWYSLGSKDARTGLDRRKYFDRKETCTDHGIQANPVQYLEGYKKGLQAFCTQESGFQFGKKGQEYKETCPLDLQEKFLSGYRIGKKEFDLERRAAELQHKQQQMEDRERQNREELERKERELEHREREFSYDLSRNKRSFVSSLNLQKKSCRFESDCWINPSCFGGRCSDGRFQCRSNSDCEIESRCDLSRTCVYRE